MQIDDKLIYDSPTKAYTDFMEGLNMDVKHSNLTNSISDDSKKIGSSWLDSFVHSDDVSDFLAHHGIKGQKWGNRRFQYGDGSLTALGRVRYGVGAARQGAGKAAKAIGGAAKKAGHALRGKVAPTDEQLYDQYNKAKYKADRKAMKEEINELKGKKKKLKDMSDQEVIDAINRYRNEKALKALQKDAGKSRARLAIEEAGRRAAAEAIANTGKSLLINAGQKLANATDTKENKAAREKQYLKDKKEIEELKSGKKSLGDRLKEEATNAENAKKAYKNKLDLEAMAGNEDAKQKLNDFNNASKGKYEREEVPREADSYETPSTSSKSKPSSFVDVVKEHGTDTYREAVTNAKPGVDYEVVDDHIKSHSSKSILSLPPARS